MSNSIYRLVARWLYTILLPILLPFLSKHQYGGLRGRSCGMATSHLLNHFLENPGSNCCLFLDLYHAFDTPRKRQYLRCSLGVASLLEFCPSYNRFFSMVAHIYWAPQRLPLVPLVELSKGVHCPASSSFPTSNFSWTASQRPSNSPSSPLWMTSQLSSTPPKSTPLSHLPPPS